MPKGLDLSNKILFCFILLSSQLVAGCALQQQGKDDQSAVYQKLQAANYVVSQMTALNSRVQSSKKATPAAKTASSTALSNAKSLAQEVQNDYTAELSKTETDPSSSNSATSNADDLKTQNLSQQVRSSANTAISHASGMGVKTSDVDPSSYLSTIEQP